MDPDTIFPDEEPAHSEASYIDPDDGESVLNSAIACSKNSSSEKFSKTNMNSSTAVSNSETKESLAGNISSVQSGNKHTLHDIGEAAAEKYEGPEVSGSITSDILATNVSKGNDDGACNLNTKCKYDLLDDFPMLQDKEDSHNIPSDITALTNIVVPEVSKSFGLESAKRFVTRSLCIPESDLNPAFQALRLSPDEQDRELVGTVNHVSFATENREMKQNEAAAMDVSNNAVDYLKFPLKYSSPRRVVSPLTSNNKTPEPEQEKNTSEMKPFNSEVSMSADVSTSSELSPNTNTFSGVSAFSLQPSSDKTKVSFSFPSKNEPNFSFGLNNDFSNLPASKNSIHVKTPSSSNSKNTSLGLFKFETSASNVCGRSMNNMRPVDTFYKSPSNFQSSRSSENTKNTSEFSFAPSKPSTEFTLFVTSLPSKSAFTSTDSSASSDVNGPAKKSSETSSVPFNSPFSYFSDAGKAASPFDIQSSINTTQSSVNNSNSTNTSFGPFFSSCQQTVSSASGGIGFGTSKSTSPFVNPIQFPKVKPLHGSDAQTFTFGLSNSVNKNSEIPKSKSYAVGASKTPAFTFGLPVEEKNVPWDLPEPNSDLSLSPKSKFSAGTFCEPMFSSREFLVENSSPKLRTGTGTNIFGSPSTTSGFSFGTASSFSPKFTTGNGTIFGSPSTTTGFSFGTLTGTSNRSLYNFHSPEKKLKCKTFQGKVGASRGPNHSSKQQVPFKVMKDQDVCVKNGVAQTIEVHHQHITAMPEYSSLSFEELRCQHEKYNGKPVTESSTKNNKKTQTTETLLDEDSHLSDIWKVLECPVCLEIVQPPVLQCEQGHHVCNNCWKRVTSCPLCKRHRTQTRNYVAEAMVDKLPLPCKYRVDGCMKTMNHKEKVSHEETCAYRTYSCLADACNQAHSFKGMMVHLKASHCHLLSGTQFCFSQGERFSWTLIKASFQKLIHAFNISDWGLFFLRHKASGQNSHLWLQMLGFGAADREYYYSVEVSDLKEMRSVTYKGPVFHLHSVINENQDCLILSGNLLSTLKADYGLHLKISIWRN